MTTATKLSGLGSWLVRGAAAAVALAFCTSAFADSSKPIVQLSKDTTKKTRKVCYVVISNSAIPQPCDRLQTPIPTTAAPMDIIR